MSQNRIAKLPDHVINKIAAGEIINRPSNALKELLENSLDAGATQIHVQVKNGGLKLLQIQDNGCGIHLEDLPLLCERYATSKLESYDQLLNGQISTFGFRGEALASISHCAKVTVITKKASMITAYRAMYSDGRLVDSFDQQNGSEIKPKPCASGSLQGTTLTVEDLFYSLPMRLKSFGQSTRVYNDEYQRIVEVVQKYAIHNPRVAFSCKKVGSPFDVNTRVLTSEDCQLNTIGQVYGQKFVKCGLLPIRAEDELVCLTLSGFTSAVDSYPPRSQLILFINQRLVESLKIKKAVEQAYIGKELSGKPGKVRFLAYLALQIASDRVDINVHPAKKEVHFLNELEVCDVITKTVSEALLQQSNVESRQLQMSTQKNSIVQIQANQKPQQQLEDEENQQVAGRNQLPVTPKPLVSQSKKPRVSEVIRTDSKTRTLESFSGFQVISAREDNQQRQPLTQKSSNKQPVQASEIYGVAQDYVSPINSFISETQQADRLAQDTVSEFVAPLRQHTDVCLKSVLQLREEQIQNIDEETTRLLINHNFVGCVDAKRALVQHETSMYMVNYHEISRDFFYMLVLRDFANFGRIVLEPSLSIVDLLAVAIDSLNQEGNLDQDEVLQSSQNLSHTLVSMSDMLDEYFGMSICKDGKLSTLPLLLENYSICIAKLPVFILRLATEVDYNSEKQCFHDVCCELSLLYQCEPDAPAEEYRSGQGISVLGSQQWQVEYRNGVEHVLMNAFKQQMSESRLPAVTKRSDQELVVDKLTDLPSLYKVFERC